MKTVSLPFLVVTHAKKVVTRNAMGAVGMDNFEFSNRAEYGSASLTLSDSSRRLSFGECRQEIVLNILTNSANCFGVL